MNNKDQEQTTYKGLIDAIKNNEGPRYGLDNLLPADFWDNFMYSSKPAQKPLVWLSMGFFMGMNDEQFKVFMESDHIVPVVGSNCLKYIRKRCDELNIKIEKNEEIFKYGVNGDGAINQYNIQSAQD